MAAQTSPATFLEVDDTAFRNRLMIGEDLEPPQREITQLMPDQTPLAIDIQPVPGRCIKTRNLSAAQGTKVFVNVCTSDAIAAPQEITDQELIDILESDEPSSFKIPMSVGAGHEEVDKSGDGCIAYDVVVNTEFLERSQASPLFHNFLIITTLEVLDHKYELNLDKNGWKVLKNKRYLGHIPQQSVRTTMPRIQELTGRPRPGNVAPARPPAPSNTLQRLDEGLILGDDQTPVDRDKHKRLLSVVKSKKVVSEGGKRAPQCVLRRVRDSATGAMAAVRAEVALPGLSSGASVSVLVGEDRLVLESATHFLDVLLPCTVVDPAAATAHFVKAKQSMVVTLPAVER